MNDDKGWKNIVQISFKNIVQSKNENLFIGKGQAVNTTDYCAASIAIQSVIRIYLISPDNNLG